MKDIKKEFPFFKENPKTVYLDTAASALKLERAIKAESEFLSKLGVNTERGMYKQGVLATNAYDNAREEVASFINAKPEEIIFTSGTTESLNMLAVSLSKKLTKEDNVIISIMEHNSSYLPWYAQSKEKGFKIKDFFIEKDLSLDYEKLDKLIDKNTKYIIMTMASNVLGNIVDVKKINEIAHKKNIKVIFDAAQGIVHEKVDVVKDDIDFLAFSGHKLYAPNGVGVLYMKEDLMDSIEPAKYGGGGILAYENDKPILKKGYHKFEVGTPPVSGAIGLAEAIRFIKELTYGKIIKHEKELIEYFLKEIKKVKHIKLINPKPVSPIFSFIFEKTHPHDIACFLSENEISVRVGFHCAERLLRNLGYSNGVVRVSFGIYNTKEDIDKVIEALNETFEFFSSQLKK